MQLTPSEEQRLADHEKTYWWHTAKRRFFRALLGRHAPFLLRGSGWVLDVGAGGGSIRQLFPDREKLLLADTNLHDAFRRAPEKYKVVCVAEKLPFRDGALSLVIAADVLEHLEKAETTVGETARVLERGGGFLVSVPAYPFLFSSHDRALGHFRRYTMKTLSRTFRGAPLKVVCSTGLFISLLPAMVLRKWISSDGAAAPRSSYVEVPGWLNRACIFWFAAEASLVKRVRIPFGASLCMLLRKESGSNEAEADLQNVS